MAVDTKPFRLIFGGGTALGRAYGLIKRMSEDIDLRIVGVDRPSKGQLRKLRKAITAALLQAGFKFDPDNPAHRMTKYKGHYTVYQIPYEPVTEGALRPEIKIELSVFSLRRPRSNARSHPSSPRATPIRPRFPRSTAPPFLKPRRTSWSP